MFKRAKKVNIWDAAKTHLKIKVYINCMVLPYSQEVVALFEIQICSGFALENAVREAGMEKVGLWCKTEQNRTCLYVT